MESISMTDLFAGATIAIFAELVHTVSWLRRCYFRRGERKHRASLGGEKPLPR
jgi:hypothetical protein